MEHQPNSGRSWDISGVSTVRFKVKTDRNGGVTPRRRLCSYIRDAVIGRALLRAIELGEDRFKTPSASAQGGTCSRQDDVSRQQPRQMLLTIRSTLASSGSGAGETPLSEETSAWVGW
jgi:hypothetical protein